MNPSNLLLLPVCQDKWCVVWYTNASNSLFLLIIINFSYSATRLTNWLPFISRFKWHKQTHNISRDFMKKMLILFVFFVKRNSYKFITIYYIISGWICWIGVKKWVFSYFCFCGWFKFNAGWGERFWVSR